MVERGGVPTGFRVSAHFEGFGHLSTQNILSLMPPYWGTDFEVEGWGAYKYKKYFAKYTEPMDVGPTPDD